MSAQRPVVVLGGGGHAKVVIDAARAAGHEVIGFVTLPGSFEGPILGVACLGDDRALWDRLSPEKVWLAHGVGSVKANTARRLIFETHRARGYSFVNVIHPSSSLAKDASVGEGTVVMAGAVVQPGVTLGSNVIINTRASIDHDSVVGAHTHVAPGATISGGVQVGEEVLVGAGAVIIQGIRVGSRSVIGAGAVVLRQVAEGQVVYGNPARPRP